MHIGQEMSNTRWMPPDSVEDPYILAAICKRNALISSSRSVLTDLWRFGSKSSMTSCTSKIWKKSNFIHTSEVNKSTATDRQLLTVTLLADRALAVVFPRRLIFVSDDRIGCGNQCAKLLSSLLRRSCLHRWKVTKIAWVQMQIICLTDRRFESV